MNKSNRRPLADITHIAHILSNNFSNREGEDMDFTGDYSSRPHDLEDMDLTGDYSRPLSILHRKSLTSDEYEKHVKSAIKKNRGQILSNEDRNCLKKLFNVVSNLVKYNNNMSRSIQQLTQEQIKFNREILETFSDIKRRTADGKKSKSVRKNKSKSIRKRRSKKK
jgi:hypothetical protein